MVKLGKLEVWSKEMCEVLKGCIFKVWETTWGGK